MFPLPSSSTLSERFTAGCAPRDRIGTRTLSRISTRKQKQEANTYPTYDGLSTQPGAARQAQRTHYQKDDELLSIRDQVTYYLLELGKTNESQTNL